MHLNHFLTHFPSGIGYRAPHRAAMLELRPDVGFLEVHAENYMSAGAPTADLLRLRRDWHVSIHGVGLSLGSVERPDTEHLHRLASLAGSIEPMLISEHLSFSRVGEDYLNDLLPMPMTPLALRVVCRNVDIVQERLGRQILVENPSRYLSYNSSTIPEAEFLNDLARRTGCGVLLDVNNVHVTCANVGGDPFAWCAALHADVIGEVHLAGHSQVDADGETLLIDDHGSEVADAVWDLFESVIPAAPMAPVLVEWDSNLPSLETLVEQAAQADAVRAGALARQQRVPARGGRHAHAL